jgi:hypothetical protein
MNTAMQFERTMMLLFGDDAYQIASQEANPTHRLQWLQKSIKNLMRLVNTLDTTPHHKQVLMTELESISHLLKGAKESSWDLVYSLLRLSFSLLGFGYARGAKCHTPIYYQTTNQYYTAHILRGGDVMQDYNDRKDAVSVRRSVVEDLKKKGLDDFKVSLVLHTSEYEIKQLRSNPTLNRTRRKRRAG